MTAKLNSEEEISKNIALFQTKTEIEQPQNREYIRPISIGTKQCEEYTVYKDNKKCRDNMTRRKRHIGGIHLTEMCISGKIYIMNIILW